jgi:hypothetical protein
MIVETCDEGTVVTMTAGRDGNPALRVNESVTINEVTSEITVAP